MWRIFQAVTHDNYEVVMTNVSCSGVLFCVQKHHMMMCPKYLRSTWPYKKPYLNLIIQGDPGGLAQTLDSGPAWLLHKP